MIKPFLLIGLLAGCMTDPEPPQLAAPVCIIERTFKLCDPVFNTCQPQQTCAHCPQPDRSPCPIGKQLIPCSTVCPSGSIWVD